MTPNPLKESVTARVLSFPFETGKINGCVTGSKTAPTFFDQVTNGQLLYQNQLTTEIA
jgi:hypothetical protein